MECCTPKDFSIFWLNQIYNSIIHAGQKQAFVRGGITFLLLQSPLTALLIDSHDLIWGLFLSGNRGIRSCHYSENYGWLVFHLCLAQTAHHVKAKESKTQMGRIVFSLPLHFERWNLNLANHNLVHLQLSAAGTLAGAAHGWSSLNFHSFMASHLLGCFFFLATELGLL